MTLHTGYPRFAHGLCCFGDSRQVPHVSVLEVPGTCLFLSEKRTHPDIHFLDSSPVSFRVSHTYQNYKMLDPLKLMSLKLIFSECLFPKHSRAPAHSQEISGSGPTPSCSVSLCYIGVLSLRLKSTAVASFTGRCLLTVSRHLLSHRRQTGMEEPKNSTVCCLLTQSLQ